MLPDRKLPFHYLCTPGDWPLKPQGHEATPFLLKCQFPLRLKTHSAGSGQSACTRVKIHADLPHLYYCPYCIPLLSKKYTIHICTKKTWSNAYTIFLTFGNSPLIYLQVPVAVHEPPSQKIDTVIYYVHYPSTSCVTLPFKCCVSQSLIVYLIYLKIIYLYHLLVPSPSPI